MGDAGAFAQFGVIRRNSAQFSLTPHALLATQARAWRAILWASGDTAASSTKGAKRGALAKLAAHAVHQKKLERAFVKVRRAAATATTVYASTTPPPPSPLHLRLTSCTSLTLQCRMLTESGLAHLIVKEWRKVIKTDANQEPFTPRNYAIHTAQFPSIHR